MMIQYEPNGAVTFISPRTGRPLFRMKDGQLVIREGHGADAMFHYIPVPMIQKVDNYARGSKSPAEVELDLGVVVAPVTELKPVDNGG